MKRKILKLNYIKLGVIAICFSFVLLSCEKYLDKAPESEYSDKEVFGNFFSFQGWVEQLYNCITDHEKAGNWSNYLLADETLSCKDIYAFDRGDYWQSNSWLYGGGSVNIAKLPSPRGNPNFNNMEDRRLWEWSWYAIAVANTALAKLEEPGLFVGTDEERNLLKGQALYFRAWFHFEICRFWGGMPYISRTLKADEEWTGPEFARTSFQETALKMADDFRAAADLLPVHWDLVETGQRTLGNNRDRANKIMALGYLGKSLLFAASPMINQEATGRNEFDPELCDRAAAAFGELLNQVDQHQDLFGLETWVNYMKNFYTWGNPTVKPGQYEGIMMPTIYKSDGTWWNGGRAILPYCLEGLWQEDIPTHNLVQNFGDDRGYPLNASNSTSEYNDKNPWAHRDLRFYKVICHDGEQFNNFPNLANVEYPTGSGNFYDCRFLQSSRTGIHTYKQGPWELGTTTGYYQKKFNGICPQFTTVERESMQSYVPYLRLADVYLMYAEAVNFKTNGGPKATSGNYALTAEGAVNKIRQRDLSDADFLNPVPAKFTADKYVFFEELIRERAVEFCFEGQRFDDLRRWNLNGDSRFLDKTRFVFDRDPDTGLPINQSVVVEIRRVAEKKHNWLPLQRQWAQKFPNFQQNPGW